MRQLATIQKISEIRPIEGADNIQMTMMQNLGWECVIAKKDNFKVGDPVVYFEVNSILPERNEFEFLREKKFRIRTIKLRGQVSQGLIMPLTILPPNTKTTVGADVTKLLGIIQYDPELQEEKALMSQQKKRSPLMKFLMNFWIVRKIYFLLFSKEKGNFPKWLNYTDEHRIQVCARLLIENFKKYWYCTEKIDGQSASFFLHKVRRWGFPSWQFGVCSREVWLKTPDKNNNYWKTALNLKLEEKFRKLNREISISGEQMGPKIQKNKYGLKELDFYIFNIYENGKRVSLDRMLELCKILELKHVPILNERFNPYDTLGNMVEVKDVVQVMVKMSSDKSKLADIPREGVVWRLIENPNVSFKVINPSFSLKYNDE